MGQITKYVFDTSFLIDALRLKKRAENVFFDFDKTDNTLYIPSIVSFELFSGASSSYKSQTKAIKELLCYFEVVELTWEISEAAGMLYRDVVKGLQVPDYIIAATAFSLDASIVTLNRKHFEKIPGIQLYPI